jgi:uncharacterized damage-inducible protein DinB
MTAMSQLIEIKELYEYNRWANGRILDAVSHLSEDQFTQDLGSSFPSVRDTLVHTLAGEWVWLSRWNGVSPTRMPAGWKESSYEDLTRHWEGVQGEQFQFLSTLDEGSLDEVISYRTTAGEPLQSSLSRMLRHVVNHSTYHRGQVVTMLRQLGAGAPATDLILFFRTAVAGQE